YSRVDSISSDLLGESTMTPMAAAAASPLDSEIFTASTQRDALGHDTIGGEVTLGKKSRVDELIEKVRTLAAARWDNERIVQYLFDADLSKSDAIVVLSRGSGMSRGDAIRIVHHSKAYEFRKAVDAAWKNVLLDFLE